MHIDDMTIGKIRQLAALFKTDTWEDLLIPAIPADLGWRIVVLDRGFVVVGEVTDYGHEIEVKRANIIRRWGTSKGLGELAEGGPRRETILDPVGEMTAPKHAVIFTIKSEEEVWHR